MPNRSPEKFGLGTPVARYEDHVLTRLTADHYLLIGPGPAPSPLWLIAHLPLHGAGWSSEWADSLADCLITHLRFRGADPDGDALRAHAPASKVAS